MTINWRKFASLAVATTPLSEGVTPNPLSISPTAITGTVDQYGAWVKLSDLADTAPIDPVKTETASLLGEQYGLTIDTLVRDVLVAGGTSQLVQNAANHTAITTSHLLTAEEVMEALATLKTANARPFSNGLFVGIIHANTEFDLLSDSTIRNIMTYANSDDKNGLWTYKLGACLGVDWYVSSLAYRVADGVGSINVYETLILGQDAYGVGGLSAQPFAAVKAAGQGEAGTGVKPGSVQIIYKGLGSAGTEDALDQKQSLGWKTTFLAKVLNSAFYVRIAHACSLG